MRNFKFVLYIFFFSIHFSLFATSPKSDLKIEFLSDNSAKYDLEEVKNLYKNNKFKKANGYLNFGFEISTVWLHIDVREVDAMQRVLMIEEPRYENVDIYFYSEERLLKVFHTGKQLDFDTREIAHPYFSFLIPFEATRVLIRLRSHSTLVVPISILTINEYLSFIIKEDAFNWMFYGFIVLIAISNILIFLWHRQWLYFYYLIFVMSMGLIVSVIKGHAFQFLWPTYPKLNDINGLFYLTIVSSIVFSAKLLELKKRTPLLYKIFQFFFVCFGLLTLIFFIYPYSTFVKIYLPVNLCAIASCLAASIYINAKFKNESSRFILAGWLLFCFCVMMYLIFIYGYIPFNVFVNNSVLIGVSFQIIFFNIAILSQINTLKKEKESLLVEHNRSLEEKVDERTMELQATNEELQAMNEEFQAMNEELQSLNEEITSQNEMLVEQHEELEMQRNSIEDQNKLIEDKNLQLEKHQVYLERQVKERTKELGLSEERYRKLVEYSPEAIVVLDEYGNFFDVNSRACSLFKMTREELLQSNPTEISPEYQLDGFLSNEKAFYYINEAIAGKNPVFEWTHKDSSGKNFDAEVWLTRLPSEDKVMIRGSVLDITDRKRHQLELKRREERLRTVVHNVPIILWACDQNGIISLLEGKAKELLNTNPEEVIGQNILKLFIGDQEQQENLQYLFNAKEDFEIQIKISRWTYDLKATRLNDEKGNYVGFIGVLIDISERIESEKRIRAFVDYQSELIDRIKLQEASLSSLINSSADMIFSVDKDFNLVEFNTSFKEEIAFELNLVLKKEMHFKQFIHPNRISSSEESFKKAFQGETVNKFGEINTQSGLKYFSITYSPIFSTTNEITGVTVICRDISEMKQAERRLLEVNKEIADYKLMALRSVMNPHFLFNSLNSIQYYIAISERKLALDYLSIFSLLIRKVLYSSLNPVVPLDEELEVLEYYISLEKLRFENKFVSEINIDPELNIEDIEIPSLLIQPYVENAILHGLLNKNEQGRLLINVSREGDSLVIVVDDNGVGRMNAQIIKENSKLREKSYGMLVTKERLEIINKTNDVSVIVEDKYCENNKPAGTKVKIFVKSATPVTSV